MAMTFVSVPGGGLASFPHHRGLKGSRIQPVTAAVQPPMNVRGTIKQVREAVQASLQARMSRIEICTPKNASFQLEKSKESSTSSEANADAASTRELTKLFIEFFRGNDLGIVAVFPTKQAADKAKKSWGPDHEYRVTSLKEMRKTSRSGFGGSAIQEDENVVIIAGGGSKELTMVQRLSDDLGQDVLIVALNMRVDSSGQDSKTVEKFRKAFDTVYWYQVGPHPRWNGGILFKSYPEDWMLCRVGTFRQVKTLLTSPTRPTEADIVSAFRGEQEDDTSQGVVDRISSLFSPLLRPKDGDDTVKK
ncbi:hypothetical protein NDN08_004136 [Rhodosorus marinus]|uniref:DUF1995 domain-containing protein n=1 Tax=Rhodosorus marinus TaxID=101924 RepID=A0AAV8UHD9_9RHOD|nr:hypothetical protein NDN08_004136 [Rhodosorus marinus]